MQNKSEIIKELAKAMEFYRELGFTYLPVKVEQKRVSAEAGKQGGSDVTSELTDLPISALKESALKALREEIGDCQRCKLCRNRKNIVFGEGSAEAKIMFIGEGPGRDEDIQARPFVGEAGKLLTSLIINLGRKREEMYIANIVKCRPPNNREPEEDEILTCRPFVEKQIEIVQPKVIVSLGKVATHALLKIRTPISRVRGNFFEYHGIPLMPTFHPAYLLRNRKDKNVLMSWRNNRKKS